jgi:hypothetical protein
MNKKDRQLTAQWLDETQGSYESLKFLIRTSKNKVEKAKLKGKLNRHVEFMTGQTKKKKSRVKPKQTKKSWFF